MMLTIKKWFYGTVALVSAFPALVHAQAQSFSAGSFSTQINTATTGLSDTPITQIIFTLMQWLLYIVGFLAVIGFVLAAIWYLTAAGDETRMENGKRALIYSIIGVIVALLGLIILNAAGGLLAGNTRF